MDLVEQLVAEQMKLGLSDRGFARHLGVSSALWMTTKQRKVRPGQKIIKSAIKKFPLLANDIVRHLAASA
jgi:lambda repressor-like predicted transcriptional regulator